MFTKKFGKIFLTTITGLVVFFVVLTFYRSHRTFDVPLPTLHAVSDTAAIERGYYLVMGPAHCADCHAALSEKSKVDSGKDAQLTGGYSIKTFLGDMIAPNITGDSQSGIGKISDAELTRFFRYGVNHKGQAGLPMMMYAELTDRDLVAILSYLRTLPPVYHPVAESDYNFLGKITQAFFLKPFSPSSVPPPEVTPKDTLKYGAYLANTVANCASCHTARDMHTGEYTGPRFAGGMVFHNSKNPLDSVISPNLTPDSSSGRITRWSNEMFIQRMKTGPVKKWSPMPWGPFSRMTKADLSAIYYYLMSLEPAHQDSIIK